MHLWNSPQDTNGSFPLCGANSLQPPPPPLLREHMFTHYSISVRQISVQLKFMSQVLNVFMFIQIFMFIFTR